MSYTVPNTEPESFYLGDTVTWTKDLTAYPASDWTLKYNFVSNDDGGNNETTTATADGDTHVVSMSKTETAAFTAGDYKWFSYVEDAGETVRYSVASGTVTFKPNQESETDTRSHAKKVLDAICANIEGIASKEQQSYSIAGRSLSRYTPAELYEFKQQYAALYEKEKQEEQVANGGGSGRTVKVRFKND